MEQIEFSHYLGAVEDPRSLVDQSKNYPHEELFGSGLYNWQEKSQDSWRHYPIRNQDGSGMCGPFSVCKALGINNAVEKGEFVNLLCAYIYNHRSNQGTGMWIQDLLQLACSIGAPLDPNLVSDNINDEQAAQITFTDQQIQEALVFRGKKYFFMNPNVDELARVIDMGLTPILLMKCAFKEWTAEPFVDTTVTPNDYNVNHFIPCVEATLYKNKKCIIIEDSWGQQYGYAGRRILSEDFIKNRVFAVGYVIDLKIEDILKPVHTFLSDIVYGASGPEVVAWQQVLQYEKFLPTHTASGTVLPLGQFLSLTAQATVAWQIAHGITTFQNENDMRKIRVGPKTREAANKIYSVN